MTGVSRHLVRLLRTKHLPNLRQGATVSVRSSLPTPTHICFQPAWRDSGHAELTQVRPSQKKLEENEVEVEMIIEKEEDQMTSLGREEPHVSISLQHGSPSPLPQASESISPTDNCENENSQHQQFQQPGTYLTVKVPEKIHLDCELSVGGGSIVVTGKVEGCVRLSTTDGEIRVKKLRGHEIDLLCGCKSACSSTTGSDDNNGNHSSSGIVYVSELLEAQKLSIKTPSRFRAKQIHGQAVAINVKPPSPSPSSSIVLEDSDDEGSLVDIGSLYVSGNGGAIIEVEGPCRPNRRAVRVKSQHGPVRVETHGVKKPLQTNDHTTSIYPIVELGGVNGACEVSIVGNSSNSNTDEEGDVRSLEETNSNWKACLAHFDSISADSVSLLSADRGDISITLDRKVETDLRLLSTSSPECLLEAGTMLAEEEDSELLVNVLRHLPQSSELPSTSKDEERIHILTKAFTPRPSLGFAISHMEYVDGYTENKSAEPDSRFEMKGKIDGSAGSVGKINLQSASDQALHGFTGATNVSGGTDDGSYLRPLVAVTTTGRIVVETVSWLGAIARRYGLDDENERELRRDSLGRTASRKGRSLQPLN